MDSLADSFKFPYFFFVFLVSTSSLTSEERILFFHIMTAYNDLVNVPSFGKKREVEFEEDRGNVVFYCRDCEKVVETTRINPNKYLYECNICKGKNISLGTEASVKEFYSRSRH